MEGSSDQNRPISSFYVAKVVWVDDLNVIDLPVGRVSSKVVAHRGGDLLGRWMRLTDLPAGQSKGPVEGRSLPALIFREVAVPG